MMMARSIYSEFKYGEQKYGGTPDPAYPFWIVQIDWDNDDIHYQPIESDRCISIEIRRGRDHLFEAEDSGKFSTVGSGFASVEPGEATIVLDNEDGRYDPWNTASPLYPHVMPGRLLKLSTSFNGTVTPQFTGRIRELEPVTGAQRDLVRIKAYDGLKELGERTLSIDVLENGSVSDAFAAVMTAAGWTGRFTTESVPIYMSYFWAEGTTPRELIAELADATMSRFFIDRSGQAHFKWQYGTISPTASLGQDVLHKTIKVGMPWDVIFNKVVVKGKQLAAYAGTTVMFTLGEKPFLPSGEQITLWCPYQYNGESVVALSAITPVIDTDLKGNTAVDGSGTNISSNLSISVTKYAGRMQVTIKNNSLSAGYVTLLQIRGTPIIGGDASQAEAEDTLSQANYGVRELMISNKWVQNLNTASAQADFLIRRTAAPLKMPIIRLQNQPALQFGIELFDAVELDLPAVGISKTLMLVGGIEHQSIDEGLKDFVTTIRLEPANYYTAILWTFDTQIGTTSIFG